MGGIIDGVGGAPTQEATASRAPAPISTMSEGVAIETPTPISAIIKGPPLNWQKIKLQFFRLYPTYFHFARVKPFFQIKQLYYFTRCINRL